jgi:hypothetical protein
MKTSNTSTRKSEPATPLQAIKYFLWWCAGADLTTLQESESDHAKFTAIGMMVAAIPCVAMVSFFSFLTLSFGASTLSAAIGGAAWGTLIFILDRLILTFHRKGRHELLRALPRLLLALCLAFVIGEPLLLRLFKGEVDLELIRSGQVVVGGAHDKAEARFKTEKDALQNANADLQKRLDDLKHVRDEKETAVIGEIEGTVGTRIKGDGLAARQKEQAFSEAKAEYERARGELLPQIAANKQRLNQIQSAIETEENSISESHSSAKGIMARHGALWAIIKREPSAAVTYVPLFLVMLLLEVSPLVMKLTSSGGEYERRLTLKEKNAIARATREAALERENQKRLVHLRRELVKQLTESAKKGTAQNLGEEEQEVVSLLRSSTLDEFRRQIVGPATSKNGFKNFGGEVAIEIVNHPELKVRLQLPAEARAATLAEMVGDMQTIGKQISEETGETVALIRATTSTGREVQRNLPLLLQLEADQKLCLTFASTNKPPGDLPVA